VILPRVSKALNANITVSDASISPFHQVVLHNLKVQTTGTEPLVSAPEVRLRYSLMQIIGGNIQSDGECHLNHPRIGPESCRRRWLAGPGFSWRLERRRGLANDLNKSPINAITALGVIGSGKIDLQLASLESPAFETELKGPITLMPILTNSTIQFPVSVSLERAVAQRINLAPANTPTNATHAKLPDFLTLTGTLGKPDKTINKTAILGMVTQGFGGTSGKTGNLLQGLGGILGNKAPASTNAPATQTPTGQKPAANPLNQFLNPKK